MRTATPLLISLEEAAFQLSIPKEEIIALIHERDLTAVKVRDKVLVAYDSVLAFTRRVKRKNAVLEVSRDSGHAAASMVGAST